MRHSQMVAAFLLALGLSAAIGCANSGVITVTVTNNSAQKLSNIVIDYPEATFGINSLDPGKSFHYSIKPTATGALKIQFVNSAGVSHIYPGPVVHKGDESAIQIKLTQDAAVSD